MTSVSNASMDLPFRNGGRTSAHVKRTKCGNLLVVTWYSPTDLGELPGECRMIGRRWQGYFTFRSYDQGCMLPLLATLQPPFSSGLIWSQTEDSSCAFSKSWKMIAMLLEFSVKQAVFIRCFIGFPINQHLFWHWTLVVIVTQYVKLYIAALPACQHVNTPRIPKNVYRNIPTHGKKRSR